MSFTSSISSHTALLSNGVCSRLAALRSEFASAFTEADRVIVTEVVS